MFLYPQLALMDFWATTALPIALILVMGACALVEPVRVQENFVTLQADALMVGRHKHPNHE